MKNLSAAEISASLTKEQKNDKEINEFLIKYFMRGKSGDWFQYRNGNGIIELNIKNGTLITTVLDDEEFNADFPLNMDISISDRCENGCKFCYAGCTPDGKEANLQAFVASKLFQSLRPGTELALNGNEPFHKDLPLLLQACHDKEIMANLTVRYNTFCRQRETLLRWQKAGLVHGIGVSVDKHMNFNVFRDFENIVFHTINGVTDETIFADILSNHKKILILGYKSFGFGITYGVDEAESILRKQEYVKTHLPEWIEKTKNRHGFSVISFDNLALEQLNLKKMLSKNEWEKFYRGDDGHHTMYIDLVSMKYCKNSMAPNTERYNLPDEPIDGIFKHIKEVSYEEKQ